MAKVYSNIVLSTADYVIEELWLLIQEYFSEVDEQYYGVYTRDTLYKLWYYYTLKTTLKRDVYYQSWGRDHLTDAEYTDIMYLAKTAIKRWLSQYDKFCILNPGLRVSDLRATHMTKKLLDVKMPLTAWEKLSSDIHNYGSSLGQQLRNQVINKQSVNLQIRQYISEKIETGNTEYTLAHLEETELTDLYINHIVDNVYDNSTEVISKYLSYPQVNRNSIKTHHKAFVDYVIVQVFGEKGYYYGYDRENIEYWYHTTGALPSIQDLQSFLNARAVSDNHCGAYADKDDVNNHKYSDYDVEGVGKLNVDFVNGFVIPKYTTDYKNNDYSSLPVKKRYQTDPDNSTGSRCGIYNNTQYLVDNIKMDVAFDMRIPTEADLKDIAYNINEELTVMIDEIKYGNRRSFDVNDSEDWLNRLNNVSKNIARDMGISSTFLEPFVNKAYNRMVAEVNTITKYGYTGSSLNTGASVVFLVSATTIAGNGSSIRNTTNNKYVNIVQTLTNTGAMAVDRR